MARREKKQLKRDIILTLCWTTATVLAVIAGVNLANVAHRAYWADEVKATVEQCKSDGLKGCHAEYITDGIVIVDYEVVGRE